VARRGADAGRLRPLAAGQIALRSDIDLHQAIGLIAHGCPVDLAVRILL